MIRLQYSAVQVGGFSLGDFKTMGKAKAAIKNAPYGFYQIINNDTGWASWEGNGGRKN